MPHTLIHNNHTRAYIHIVQHSGSPAGAGAGAAAGAQCSSRGRSVHVCQCMAWSVACTHHDVKEPMDRRPVCMRRHLIIRTARHCTKQRAALHIVMEGFRNSR